MMAVSRSVLHDEIPKACDLCETEIDIKWKCIQSGQVMCDKCKKIHPGTKISDQHDIVIIESLESQVFQPVKVNTNDILCDKHPLKMSCLFCRTCDQLVCPDCITSVHKKHDFDPIDEAVKEKVDYLKVAEAKVCKDLTFCKLKVKEIGEYEAKCDSIIEEEISTIKENENELIDAIRKTSIQLQNQLETEKKISVQVFDEVKGNVNNSEKDLLDKHSQIQAALTSTQESHIFATASKFKLLPELKFDFEPSEITKLIPDRKSLDVLNLFGSLEKTKITLVETTLDFHVVKSCTTDLQSITRLISTDEQTAWISDHKKKLLQKVSIENDKTTVIQEISVSLFDMTLTPTNDILMVIPTSSDIKLLSKTGEIETIMSVSPLIPFGIHVTSDNFIIVGVIGYKVMKDTIALYVYGMDRKRKKCHEYERRNRRLFTFPFRIKTNINNDIVVNDKLEDDLGRVVVIGWEGGLKWIYDGHPIINERTKFTPLDIETTPLGHVIVNDLMTHALHVLSKEGSIVSCHVMNNVGIIYPQSLNIDRRGLLWVGAGDETTDDDTKIHMVQFH